MKYWLYIVFFLLLFNSLHAQTVTFSGQNEDIWYTEPRSRDKEFLIYQGFGLSGLNYSVSVGKRQDNLGLQFGLGFRLGLSESSSMWSLVTGAELSLYKTSFELENLSTYSDMIDMDGSAFEFRNIVDNCKENQQAIMLQIPLMLQFQTDNERACEFYFAVGGKVGMSINGTYKTSIATIKNSGYHADTDSEFDTQQFMGFGTFTDRKNNGKLKFNAAFLASAETGLKFTLENMALYVGVYLDYGLNNIQQPSERPFVEYNNQSPRDFIINSVTESVYMQTNQPQSFTEKIIPMAMGIRIRMGF